MGFPFPSPWRPRIRGFVPDLGRLRPTPTANCTREGKQIRVNQISYTFPDTRTAAGELARTAQRASLRPGAPRRWSFPTLFTGPSWGPPGKLSLVPFLERNADRKDFGLCLTRGDAWICCLHFFDSALKLLKSLPLPGFHVAPPLPFRTDTRLCLIWVMTRSSIKEPQDTRKNAAD